MATTRASLKKASQDAFTSTVETLLDVLPEESIPQALTQAGLLRYEDFVAYRDDVLATLSYKQKDSGAVISLIIHEVNLLRILKRFLLTKQLAHGDGTRLTPDELTKFTQDEYDDFRTGPEALEDPMPVNIPQVSKSSSLKTSDPVSEFKKGIKRDISSYPVLKDNRFFDKFELEFTTIAKAHDVIEVFTPSYKPSGNDEKALFKEKLKFGMSVLVTCIKTDVGISFVREHQRDGDAQQCWSKIYNEARTSTRAELDLADLEDQVMQTKLESGWRGTLTGFLTYWKELPRKQEELAPTAQRYTFPLKKRMLKSRVLVSLWVTLI